MRDRIFLPLLALVALALIALALVWPQGQGAPSPPPFGHPLAPLPQKARPTRPAPGAGRLDPASTFGQVPG
jgi:hypothetical protein